MSDVIREAASVVAVRSGAEGPQVLVLERGPDSRFLPSYIVFPGGAVDGDDAALAERWFGSPDEAARAAAVRELVEEAGLALTATGIVDAGEPDTLARIHAAPPTADQLRELCHWIAPEEVPVRFDARYYAVEAPAGLDPAPDGDEAIHAWWVSPAMLWPSGSGASASSTGRPGTRCTRLAECVTAEDLLGLRFETREPNEERGRTHAAFGLLAGLTGAGRIVRVLAPNPSVYTLEGTNTWIVGRGSVAVIDPGPLDDGHLNEVASVASGAGRVTAVLVTHDHPDHAPGRRRSPPVSTRRSTPSA